MFAWDILAFIFTLIIFFIAMVIFFENGDPSKTLAWLLILVFLPGLGFILYLLIGRKFTKIRKYHIKRTESLDRFKDFIRLEKASIDKGYSFIEHNLPHKRKLISLIANTASAPFTLNNQTKVYNNGQEAFTDILSSLEKAQDHIHLEFYIFRSDTIGRKIQKILINKAQQGVKVRLIYDGMGSRGLERGFLAELRANGVEVACFAPVYFPLINNRINYRNHRKIIIIDGQVGYVGGMNVGDEYLGDSKTFSAWRDTHLGVHGDAVHFLQYIFLQDWSFITKQNIDNQNYYPQIKGVVNEELIQVAASGPDSPWEPIMQMYFSMIATANKSIYLTTPYFVPNESILMAIKNAALSGVDVRILVPGKPDKPFVFWASMSYFKELLEAGVRIYRYQKGFIHSKTLVVDGIVSSIGTANMDNRSFNLNFEVNAFIYNHQVAGRLEEDFLQDLQDSKEINFYQYEKRSLWIRFLESAARLFSPLL